MSNVAKVLKAEIARINKREAKSATQGIKDHSATVFVFLLRPRVLSCHARLRGNDGRGQVEFCATVGLTLTSEYSLCLMS
jgi:hypothetical protein